MNRIDKEWKPFTQDLPSCAGQSQSFYCPDHWIHVNCKVENYFNKQKPKTDAVLLEKPGLKWFLIAGFET